MYGMASEFVILLVEDNPGDVLLVREALGEAGIRHRLHVAEDAFQALDFLHQRGVFIAAPRPDLVVLDLNLPGKPGKEVMAEMETSAGIRDLPVAVLTTSSSESEICSEFPGLRGMFAVKTPDLGRLAELMRDFEQFARQPI